MKFRDLLQEPPLVHSRIGAVSSDPEPGVSVRSRAWHPRLLCCSLGSLALLLVPVGSQHHCSRSCPSLPPCHIPVCSIVLHSFPWTPLCTEASQTPCLGTERQNSGHRGWFGSLLTGTPTSLQRNSTRVQAVHLPRSQQPAKGA